MRHKRDWENNDKLQRFIRSLGKAISDLRKQQGLNRKELAEKAGISLSYLARIETNTSDSPSVVSVTVLYDITDALGIKMKEFLVYVESIERTLEGLPFAGRV